MDMENRGAIFLQNICNFPSTLLSAAAAVRKTVSGLAVMQWHHSQQVQDMNLSTGAFTALFGQTSGREPTRITIALAHFPLAS